MGRQFNRKKLACQLIMGLTLGSSCLIAQAAAADSEPIEEYSLDDIVVTAAREHDKQMETPARTETVSAQDIEDNHYSDIGEALSNVSGVSVEQTGDSETISINGDERIVILVDGVRMNNSQGTGLGKSTVSTKMIPSLKAIEKIEVIRGAGSAMYGSDAVGGVINIVTKDVTQNKGNIDFSTGSWGTYNYEGSFEGKDNDLSWLVTGDIKKQNHVRYKMNGYTRSVPHSDTDNNDFSVNLKNKLDKSSSLALNYTHKTIHQGLYYNAVNFGDDVSDGDWTEINNDLSLQYNFKQDQNTPGYLRVYNNARSTHYDSQNVWNKSKTQMRDFGVDYQNGWTFGDNTLIAGAEWRQSKMSSYPETGGGYDGKTLRSFAVYLQDTWQFAKKWSFVPGLRVEHHNSFGTHWTPKAALNYNADDKTQVFASWGRVFRAPTAYDMYSDFPGMGTGNPDLKPESGHTETFGITHKFDKDSTLSFTLFNTVLNDAIIWGFDGSNYTSANAASTKKRGFDISYSQKLSKIWSFDVGYSFLHQEAESGNSAYRDLSDGIPGNKQPNVYRLGLKFHQGPWKSNLYVKNISGLDTSYYLSRSYTVIDWNLSYDFSKQGTIYLKINNLTNQEYSSYMTVDHLIRPANGRSFMIGVNYSF